MQDSSDSAICDRLRSYVGKPWVAGARGPLAFDCWGLLRHVQHFEFNRPLLPNYPIPPALRVDVTLAIEGALAGQDWQQLGKAVHSCAVGLSNNARLHHVGVFVATDGGLVLHALEKHGVIAQSVPQLRARGWRRIEFYWHRTW